MIRTPICDLLGIDVPVALGGMGSIYAPPLTAAVSNAGGLGALGTHRLTPDAIRKAADEVRALTAKPFALNFLIFDASEEQFAAGLAAKPPMIAFAWPRGDQEFAPWIDRAHEAGAKVTFMVPDVAMAERAAKAGADVIVAQGSEGGGHVGWTSLMPLLPMVVDAVAPTPVLGAGGMADGRGLAAALALGADGILLGTRFLASEESPLHPNFKQAIVDSTGEDTLLTEIPDLASGVVWPGAMSRAYRNRFIERWAGREWAIRGNREAIFDGILDARKRGDADEAPLSMGEDSGLIKEILPAAELVRRIAAEAEQVLLGRLAGFVTT